MPTHSKAYASASICYDRLGFAEDSACALANRGVELYELARPEEAIGALERAHREFIELDDRLWQALCQTNLSQAWIAAGRYLEAFTCLDAAETALTGLDRTTELTRVQVDRARCMESLGLDVEALDLYDELIDPLSNAALVDDLGRVHLGRGTILVRSGDRVTTRARRFVQPSRRSNRPVTTRCSHALVWQRRRSRTTRRR